MHVGTQQFNTSNADLEYLVRHGVFNKNENFITFSREYGWDIEELVQKKKQCAEFGVDMEMVAIPNCSAQYQWRSRSQLYAWQL